MKKEIQEGEGKIDKTITKAGTLEKVGQEEGQIGTKRKRIKSKWKKEKNYVEEKLIEEERRQEASEEVVGKREPESLEK